MHTELFRVAALSIAHALFKSVDDLPRALVEALGSVWLAVRKFDLHLGRGVPVARRVARVYALSVITKIPSCVRRKERTGIYVAPFTLRIVSKRSDIDHMHSFTWKLHRACLSFVSIHQMASPLTEAADIQLPGRAFRFTFYLFRDPETLTGQIRGPWTAFRCVPAYFNHCTWVKE